MLSLSLGLKIIRDAGEQFTTDVGRPHSPQPSVWHGPPSLMSASALLRPLLQRLAFPGDGRGTAD